MKTVNIHEAKTHLSKLLEEVESGNEIVIARSGKPIARLIGISQNPPDRVGGQLAGKIWMSDDFDACDAEIEKMFYGEDD